MPCSTHALIPAIRDVLAQHDVHNARVVVELLPEVQSSNNGTPVRTRNVSIVVRGAEDELLLEGEPAEHPAEPPKPFPPPRPHSPSKRVNARGSTPLANSSSGSSSNSQQKQKQEQEQQHLQQERESEDNIDEMSNTARPEDVQGHCHAAATSTTPTAAEANTASTPSGATRQATTGKSATPHSHPNAPAPAALKKLPTHSVKPHPPDASRETKDPARPSVSYVTSSSSSSSSSGSRKPSVVVKDAETTERPSSVNSLRKVSSVHVLEASRSQEARHQPILGDAGEEARRPSILVSSASAKSLQPERDSCPNGKNDGDATKLPRVVEKTSHAGANTTGNTNNNSRGARSITPTQEAGKLNSKQRLQEMLEEQRAMEQQSMLSRARHDELIREAEKYLEELQRIKAARPGGADAQSLPVISPRSASSTKQSMTAGSSSTMGPSGSNGIRVVKFTMPEGRKAKDEVVMQLSSSPGGAQILSSKDKFSMLLREQERILREKDASEQEYQKLLQQAITYHKQQKQLKELREQQGQERDSEEDY
ncbi:hypothetical protein DQ04_00751100 [Trypanosoma grayi]|uniref:hypothetical protein n=1 Tax=Trypanosoma grayi TaxID=71804 RepID=UPI0004F49B92|nr:hypothetical protein DQ04_00751100 [Trypanosoma grayi]KEG13850.1 hypothetical protein DQ04_00751100 [Trypanosoma grayi]